MMLGWTLEAGSVCIWPPATSVCSCIEYRQSRKVWKVKMKLGIKGGKEKTKAVSDWRKNCFGSAWRISCLGDSKNVDTIIERPSQRDIIGIGRRFKFLTFCLVGWGWIDCSSYGRTAIGGNARESLLEIVGNIILKEIVGKIIGTKSTKLLFIWNTFNNRRRQPEKQKVQVFERRTYDQAWLYGDPNGREIFWV